jgi:hypothetical protein
MLWSSALWNMRTVKWMSAFRRNVLTPFSLPTFICLFYYIVIISATNSVIGVERWIWNVWKGDCGLTDVYNTDMCLDTEENYDYFRKACVRNGIRTPDFWYIQGRRWRQYIFPNRLDPSARLHCVINQKVKTCLTHQWYTEAVAVHSKFWTLRYRTRESSGKCLSLSLHEDEVLRRLYGRKGK